MKISIFFLALFLSIAGFAQEQKIRVLSLDGGGVRGAATLEILKNMRKDTGVNFHDDFDVFAGTSTGSIIALCLASGIDVTEALTDYETMSEKAFSDYHYVHLFRAEYSQQALKDSILSIMSKQGFGPNATLGDLPKKVVVPAVKLDDGKDRRWKMKILENFTPEGKKIKIIDAILESTAAPLYFPSDNGYVDGGVAMNDPSLAAIMAAYDPEKNDLKDFVILSVGTGYERSHVQGNEDWGTVQWLEPSGGSLPIISLIMDTGEQIPAQACAKLLGKAYKRVDFPLAKPFPLDDYEQISQLLIYTDNYFQKPYAHWQEICMWIENYIEKKETP